MRTFLFIVLSFFFLSSFAQPKYSTKKKKAIQNFVTAEKDFYAANFKDAMEKLDKAIDIDENFIEAYLLRGQIYYEIADIENEAKQYEKVLEINPNYSPKVHNLLGTAYFNLEKYRKSAELYQTALNMDIKSEWLFRKLETGLEAAKFAAELYENPVPFTPVNLGENVNSPYDDYWPMISANGKTLYTTKNIPIRNDIPFGRNNANEDFFINHLESDSTWGQVYSIGPPLNTRHNEGAPTISADGQTFAFTACNRKDGHGQCDIYIARREGNRWTTPKNIGEPINTRKLERQPSLSADGRSLYFTSDRAGTDGLEDLWVSHFDGSKWSEPINLGDSVNTDGLEWAPFIHPDDKTLYFVSNGHLGMGGLDIFKTTKINDSTWTKPLNLGYPINTVYDEQSLFVSIAGDLALISSNRANDENGLDIYSFELYKEAQPDYVSYVEGIISDANSQKPLNVTMELIDLKTGKLIMQPESDATSGTYLLCLPSNKEYMLNISKEGYMPYSEHFSLESQSKFKPLRKDIQLQAIELNAQVILKNIFFELDSYELKPESKLELAKLIQFLNQNSNVSIEIGGHTDNQGTKAYNITLSQNRSKTVYEYLIQNGIKASRLSYKGYGLSQPIDTNDTAEGRANNRRTEFKIVGL